MGYHTECNFFLLEKIGRNEKRERITNLQLKIHFLWQI